VKEHLLHTPAFALTFLHISSSVKQSEQLSTAKRGGCVQEQQRKSASKPANASQTFVTRAIGLEETTGHLRARRSSLFTQSIILVTGLICFAFLLGSLAQAWSNSILMQQVQETQLQTQQSQIYHDRLVQQAKHYSDPFIIESEARQDLGYIRPGEHSVVIIGSNHQDQQNTPQTPQTPASQSFWQQWWNVFFGNE
jgi:cell division protein FtsB